MAPEGRARRATLDITVASAETLREDVLPALGFSVTEAASALGVTRVPFSSFRKPAQ